MEFNEYETLVVTLGEALKELAEEAKLKRNVALGTENENFQEGYLCAFHRIITLFQQQADIYDISLEKLSLDKIKETDLI